MDVPKFGPQSQKSQKVKKSPSKKSKCFEMVAVFHAGARPINNFETKLTK